MTRQQQRKANDISEATAAVGFHLRSEKVVHRDGVSHAGIISRLGPTKQLYSRKGFDFVDLQCRPRKHRFKQGTLMGQQQCSVSRYSRAVGID